MQHCKRLLACVLTLVLALSIAGCGSTSSGGSANSRESAVFSRPTESSSNGEEKAESSADSSADTPDPETDLVLDMLSSAQSGDIITFGSYEQNNDPTNGREPIEWIVLENEGRSVFAVSRYLLDEAPFHLFQTYEMTWERSDLRAWLNTVFYEEAFNSDEKLRLLDNTVVTEPPSTDPSGDSETTYDRVFLLSENETNRYFPKEEDRIAEPTAYARAQVNYETNKGLLWWLRTMGHVRSDAQSVLQDGFITGTPLAGEYTRYLYDSSPEHYEAARKQGTSEQRAMYVRPAVIIQYDKKDTANDNTFDASKLYSENAILQSAKTGDTVSFGGYEQSVGGTGSYRYEDIRWRVIDKDGNRLLLLSESGLDAKPFEYDWHNTQTSWTSSGLHEWLNSTFYYHAFSSLERERILRTDTGSEASFVTNVPDSGDRVFLLSLSEAEKYHALSSDYYLSPTAYAESGYENFSGRCALNLRSNSLYCYWWLRTVGTTSGGLANHPAVATPSGTVIYDAVSSDGKVSYEGIVLHDPTILIRPAIWVTFDPDMPMPSESSSQTEPQEESSPESRNETESRAQEESREESREDRHESSASQSEQESREESREESSEPDVSYAYLKDAQIGDYIRFGTYEQDNQTSNGREEIEWLVLDKVGSRLLVVSVYALDCMAFHDGDAANWEDCTLRAWLNGPFLQEAFTASQQRYIPTVELKTGNRLVTQDRIFILSPDEIRNYLSDRETSPRLYCKATEYAIAKGIDYFHWTEDFGSDDAKVRDGNCIWWMRQNSIGGSGTRGARAVDVAGRTLAREYKVYYDKLGVRPAMWIETNS